METDADWCKMYYQYSPDNLPTCPVTIHALLHIVGSIEASGPMWEYWAFPTEYYCGSLVPAVRSCQFPFQSIDWHVMEVAQLIQIKMFHCLHNALSLMVVKNDVAGQFSVPECECDGCFGNIWSFKQWFQIQHYLCAHMILSFHHLLWRLLFVYPLNLDC